MMAGPTFDHAAAVAMVADGKLLSEVAAIYGVTKERVRQICAKHGVSSRQSAKNLGRRNRAIAEMRSAGVPLSDVADAFDVDINTASKAALKHGVYYAAVRRAQFAPLIAEVRAGASIRAVAERAGVDAETLRTWVRAAGVESVHGPHRDLSHRYDLAPQMRADGATWADISAAFAEVEGRPLLPGAAHSWAYVHMPELIRPRQEAA